MDVLDIFYNILDLFKVKEREEYLEDLTCTICLEVYNEENKASNLFTCPNNHMACLTCWNKIIASNNKSCMMCRVPIINIGVLKKEENSNKRVVTCPYLYSNICSDELDKKLVEDLSKGCKSLVRVDQLSQHIKVCESRFVLCINRGCKVAEMRYGDYIVHKDECKHALLKCNQCNEAMVKRLKLNAHLKNHCTHRTIKCNECLSPVIYKYQQKHIDKDCPNTNIKCTYHQFGCLHEVKRSELDSHLVKVNHAVFVSKYVEEQNHVKYNLELELQESNKKCNEVLKKCQDLELKLQQLETQNQILFLNYQYKNVWFISNFLNKIQPQLITTNGNGNNNDGVQKVRVNSAAFTINNIQLYVSCGYNNDNNVYFFLMISNFDSQVKVSVEFLVKLINSKDSNKNVQFIMNQEYTKGDNGWGRTFGDSVKFNQDTGFIAYDGSITLEFTVTIKKPPLSS